MARLPPSNARLWICRRLLLRLPALLRQLIAGLFEDAAEFRLLLFGDPGQIDIEDAERLWQEREHQLEVVLPALLAQLRNEPPSLGFEISDKRGEERMAEHAAQLGGVEVAQRRAMIGGGIEAAGLSGHEACSDVSAARAPMVFDDCIDGRLCAPESVRAWRCGSGSRA